ncbi:type II secretion system F family protein [Sulfurimonas sp. SAG-AH-194-I05]|nr:type II secretion system F family protein [Sulfurimonas sp. SAG-AH-194-I05]MDF1874947.1 type II secretion system F family protein [Sulfurimonas sp. SAG-AH-194-I05]
MKIDIKSVLKTLLFTLENGKSLSHGISLLSQSSPTKKERSFFVGIYKELQEGATFSQSLKKSKVASLEVANFIAMAEQGTNFKKSLANIISYIEVKENFERESNDKITLPFIYFTFAFFIVIGVTFFGVPYQISKSQEYTPEIVALITEHLQTAQTMADILFVMLAIVFSYFIILMIALFSKSNMLQLLAKEIGLVLPFVSKIIKKFDKFILFSMMSEMLKSGISFQKGVASALEMTTITHYKKALAFTLQSIKYDGKLLFHSDLYEVLEQKLMLGVGSSIQIGNVMSEMSKSSQLEALRLSTHFFRGITLVSILLMAFAVFIEFYTIVLTQIIIQKGLIDLTKGIG